MSVQNKTQIAGLSLTGGKKEEAYSSLLEFFPEEKRWFLKSLNHLKDDQDGESIAQWLQQHHITQMVVDFPLSLPSCQICDLDCPGVNLCSFDEVELVKKRIHDLIEEDQQLHSEGPKSYERGRVAQAQIEFYRDILQKEVNDPILSKSFKRKLKKGYLPYWNRPIDFWVWLHYYDYLLYFFKYSFDSFANSSFMLLSRFVYLKKHFPSNLKLFESDRYLCLLELHKAKLLGQSHLLELKSFEGSVGARIKILQEIEKKLGIFIYDKDLTTLIYKPKAFYSFLMAVVGQRAILEDIYDLPDWASREQKDQFIVPKFGKKHDS